MSTPLLTLTLAGLTPAQHAARRLAHYTLLAAEAAALRGSSSFVPVSGQPVSGSPLASRVQGNLRNARP